MVEQRSLDWYRARLGKITGSCVSVIFQKGKAKDKVFGDTALNYLHGVAAERNMNEIYVNDDILFEEYIESVDVSTKAMRWGVEQEDFARDTFQDVKGIKVTETGSCQHPEIPFFAASPDGLTEDGGIIEIKCPTMKEFIKYKTYVTDGESLKKVKPEYFYQMQAEMDVTGRSFGYFVSWCPWQRNPIYIVRIERDDEVLKEMHERLFLADDYINAILGVKK